METHRETQERSETRVFPAGVPLKAAGAFLDSRKEGAASAPGESGGASSWNWRPHKKAQ